MLKFVVFFVLIYFFMAYYLYRRLLFFFNIKRKVVRNVFRIFCLLFFIGEIIERFFINFFTEFIVGVGAIFLFFFFYFLMFSIVFDFFSLFFRRIKIFKREIATVAVLSIFILFGYGYWNFYNLNVKYLNIDINKAKFDRDTLYIAYVSDIHLGTFVNKSKLNILIDTITAHKPDILLIGGDLIDNNIEVVKYYDLLKYFKKLNLPLGIYMCPGNHEYIGRYFMDLKYIEENNIKILKDTTIQIDSLFYLVSRDDIRNRRKGLDKLVENIDPQYPIILLDHQPWKLDEAKKFLIDLQLSGHTHHGQIFPINFITKFLYEKDWGYLKKEKTHYYISCGYGGALFPIRIGSTPEIVFINLVKKES